VPKFLVDQNALRRENAGRHGRDVAFEMTCFAGSHHGGLLGGKGLVKAEDLSP